LRVSTFTADTHKYVVNVYFANYLIFFTCAEFDTSCFTGEYVTGETIGNEYFQRIHNLRNDAAQEERRSGKPAQKEAPAATGSQGCESVHNDERDANNVQNGCEAI